MGVTVARNNFREKVSRIRGSLYLEEDEHQDFTHPGRGFCL
jgi:hypothetical protein